MCCFNLATELYQEDMHNLGVDTNSEPIKPKFKEYVKIHLDMLVTMFKYDNSFAKIPLPLANHPRPDL